MSTVTINNNPVSEEPQVAGGFAPRRRGSRMKQQVNCNSAIEDLLKVQQESNSMAMKTPVSILQELLSRRGITPSYELVQIEGAIHEPTFRYRVSFNDKDIPLTAMGAGRSKKEAKHAAAKALIDKLNGVSVSDSLNTCPTTNGDIQLENNNVGYGEDKVVGNPIGWLQELCMARRWPPPTYETEMEVGLPHERQFTIACTILKYREVGRGKSKKVAKRLAAHKMWTKLQENPLDQNQITEILDEDGNDSNRTILNRYADLKDISIPIINNTISQKVSNFHKAMKASKGVNVTKLKNSCLNDHGINYVQFLADIASEHSFEVTYVDIEERTYSGRYQCLVQLSTLPVAVCQGSGDTLKEAQINAARNALEYLKVMVKP